MKIAILGTRGIPNNYGGFEQFAEYISVGLVEKGHEVTVYNPQFHPYSNSTFKGVNIIKIKSPEEQLGSAGNFIYDYYCLKDAVKRDFDIIYEAGYATCSPFFYLMKQTKAKLITNMDGLEWKRSKWNFVTKKIMKYLEGLAVKKSPYLISDNKGIQEYYLDVYKKQTFLAAYGADVISEVDINQLQKFNIEPCSYFMLIARMEPENNIELILRAYAASGRSEPFLVIGNYKNKYGSFLRNTFKNYNIKFCGSIYDKPVLDALRYYAKAYLHGHSVGGTNPSLLEAIASSSFIVAHNNNFNAAVLNSNAVYFNSTENLEQVFRNIDALIADHKQTYIANNLEELTNKYNWQTIINLHEEIFENILYNKKILSYE